MTYSPSPENNANLPALDGASLRPDFSLEAGHARSALWLEPEQRLARDVFEFQKQRTALSKIATLDDSRVLCVVSCLTRDDAYLAGSLPALMGQLNGAGKRGDILVGLNHGAQAPLTYEALRHLPNIEIEHAFCGPKIGVDFAASVRDPAYADRRFFLRDSESPEKHRVTFVQQPAGRFTHGKIRMLRDLYELCGISIQAGRWQLPSQLFTLDAETHLMERGEVSRGSLFAQLEQEKASRQLSAIGTDWRLSPFQETRTMRFPDPSAPVSHEHVLIEQLFGTEGFQYLPGGGTLIDSLDGVALGQVVSRYPGVRQEDIMMTVVADSAGLAWGLSHQVQSSNKCARADLPSSTEQIGSQIIRWYAGIHALSLFYGADQLRHIADPKVFYQQSIQSFVGNDLEKQAALVRLREFAQQAAAQPDSITGGGAATASW